MKKIIRGIGLVAALAVAVPAYAAQAQEAFAKEIEKQTVELKGSEQTRQETVEKQLQIIAARLAKELKKEVSSNQVVKWLYQEATADFENSCYYQFKWERSQRYLELIGQPGHEKEKDELQEDVEQNDPRVKEFIKYRQHVTDEAFAQVFTPEQYKGIFPYGDLYNPRVYPRVKDVKKFKADTNLLINNLYDTLTYFAEQEDQFFLAGWAWLLED